MFLRGLREAFAKPQYVVLAITIASGAFLFTVWLPNFSLIAHILSQPTHVVIKLQLLIGLTESIGTNFSTLSATTTIASAILFGIDVALITYYLKKRAFELRQGAVVASFGGVVSGILGIGCAACGSFILSNLLATVGLSGGIALLPLRGGEFGIVSVALLCTSLALVAKRIGSSNICDPSESRNEK